jgi:hypothetical protein
MGRRVDWPMRRPKINVSPRQDRDEDEERADPAGRARLFGPWRNGRATFARPVTDDEPCESFQHGCASLITRPLCHTPNNLAKTSCARLLSLGPLSPPPTARSGSAASSCAFETFGDVSNRRRPVIAERDAGRRKWGKAEVEDPAFDGRFENTSSGQSRIENRFFNLHENERRS